MLLHRKTYKQIDVPFIKALKLPQVKIPKENDVLKLLREVFYMIDHLKEKVCIPTTFAQLNDKS